MAPLVFHMLTPSLSLSFLLIPLISVTTSTTTSYTPLDNIALNCGHHGDIIAPDGRNWTGDVPSEFISNLNSSSPSTASTQYSDVPQIPYMTARISLSPFTYSFPILSPAPLFIRLHFHSPDSYSALHVSNAFFSVSLNNNYTLLRNFSTFLTSRFLNQSYFLTEFIYIVSHNTPFLNITFIPSPSSFAFINGIELVSMPDNLYLDPAKYIPIVGQSQSFILDNSTVLQMLYRFNVDGQSISPPDDTGMFRDWSQDIDYIYGAATGQDPYHITIPIKYTKVPSYTAPEILYRTARSMGTEKIVNDNYNLTWLFPVDSGFYYLIRLHFCEIAPEITGINQRVFQIFLYNQTAEDQMDIMVYAGGIGVPIYRDFIVMVPETGGKTDLWLALHPNTRAHAKYSDAILNGLEIFKLNKSDGSLAGPNPNIPDLDHKTDLTEPYTQRSDHPNKIRIPIVVAGAVLLVLCMISLFVIRGRRCKKTGTSDGWGPFSLSGFVAESSKTRSTLPTDLCRCFSLAEIKSATNDFSAALLIGVGGFGNVYRGCVDDGATPVAIKRSNPTSQQGAHEFRTEIEMLSQLRHLHLVSLIGYCADDKEMILVYDYMARGTLRDHLYNNNDNPPLPWKLRLQICIGAARGLHYLHTGAKHTIIHRDVKSTNILLDENYVAKVSDFGLSKVGPTGISQTHVSTIVKGSFGYVDPEYYRLQQLTEKSDVYSFGVVLFEVLCARPAADKNLEKDEICLSEWARAHYRKGKLDQIVDPYLRGKIGPESLRKFGDIANSCLIDHGIERPTMNDVVWNLEFALQQQESWGHGEINGEENPFGACFVSGDRVVESLGGHSTLGLSGSVFSEILNPKGR